jgi:chromosome segregation ATPase
MSDKELIAFLRDLPFLRAAAAADRIEELTKLLATTKDTLNICRAANADMAESVEGFFQERDELTEQLEAARADAKEAEAYAEGLEKEIELNEQEACMVEDDLIKADKEIDDLKAKLAKAVDVLRTTTQILSQCLFETILVKGQYLDRKEVVASARATLAEIEGLGVKQTG